MVFPKLRWLQTENRVRLVGGRCIGSRGVLRVVTVDIRTVDRGKMHASRGDAARKASAGWTSGHGCTIFLKAELR